MTDLSNIIAHILEHKQHLADANEATIQQYVVLPILRALEWDDTNLASMEIIPEYQVESRRADYALHIKQKQDPAVLIECKRWNQPIGKNEEQICFYAYSGNVPLAIITNGKRWRFYLSRWEASSLSDRIFCETDIEDRENAVVDLEKYLLKSNVASSEAELNAEIALEEKEKTNSSKSSPVDIKQKLADGVNDNQSERRQDTVPPEPGDEWTTERIRNSLPQEVKDYHEKYPKERCDLFYRGAAQVGNLMEEKEWRLDVKISKVPCSFFLKDRGVTRIKRIFGLILSPHLPHGRSVDRNGKQVSSSAASTPPRLFVRIMEEEAKQLEREYGCEFCAISRDSAISRNKTDLVYYHIPENMSELLPVLEFAYKKHTGN